MSVGTHLSRSEKAKKLSEEVLAIIGGPNVKYRIHQWIPHPMIWDEGYTFDSELLNLRFVNALCAEAGTYKRRITVENGKYAGKEVYPKMEIKQAPFVDRIKEHTRLANELAKKVLAIVNDPSVEYTIFNLGSGDPNSTYSFHSNVLSHRLYNAFSDEATHYKRRVIVKNGKFAGKEIYPKMELEVKTLREEMEELAEKTFKLTGPFENFRIMCGDGSHSYPLPEEETLVERLCILPDVGEDRRMVVDSGPYKGQEIWPNFSLKLPELTQENLPMSVKITANYIFLSKDTKLVRLNSDGTSKVPDNFQAGDTFAVVGHEHYHKVPFSPSPEMIKLIEVMTATECLSLGAAGKRLLHVFGLPSNTLADELVEAYKAPLVTDVALQCCQKYPKQTIAALKALREKLPYLTLKEAKDAIDTQNLNITRGW